MGDAEESDCSTETIIQKDPNPWRPIHTPQSSDLQIPDLVQFRHLKHLSRRVIKPI